MIFDNFLSFTKSGRPITIFQPAMCADEDATTHLFSYGDFSDKISSLANLMKIPLSKVAFLNDQNTFLVVKCFRLPFRSVESGWQWISEGLNCVRFLFKLVTRKIGSLSHLNDFHVFPRDNIRKLLLYA